MGAPVGRERDAGAKGLASAMSGRGGGQGPAAVKAALAAGWMSPQGKAGAGAGAAGPAALER
eukprot:scaffold83291_cov13-Tisochrysis_lutea.AAC.1